MRKFKPWLYADCPKSARGAQVDRILNGLLRSTRLAEKYAKSVKPRSVSSRKRVIDDYAENATRFRFRNNLDAAETARALLAHIDGSVEWPVIDARLLELRAVRDRVGV